MKCEYRKRNIKKTIYKNIHADHCRINSTVQQYFMILVAASNSTSPSHHIKNILLSHKSVPPLPVNTFNKRCSSLWCHPFYIKRIDN